MPQKLLDTIKPGSSLVRFYRAGRSTKLNGFFPNDFCPGRKIRKLLAFFLFCAIPTIFADPCEAEEENKDPGYNIIPIAEYSKVKFGERSVESPGLAIAVKNENNKFIGAYQYSEFKEPPLSPVPFRYHAINFLGDINHRPWNSLIIFKSQADHPVTGGLKTYQLGLARGYYLWDENNSSLVLGGGIAHGDFGLKLAGGKVLPLIPVPLIRYRKEWEYLSLSFDFLTGPNLSWTLGPRSKIRLVCDVRMDNFRDADDIIFESILWYRFFESNHEYGDFAGLGLGLKRDELSFDLARRENSFALQYNSAFITFDISLLRVTAGRTFNVIERYGDEIKTSLEKGKFAEFRLLYLF